MLHWPFDHMVVITVNRSNYVMLLSPFPAPLYTVGTLLSMFAVIALRDYKPQNMLWTTVCITKWNPLRYKNLHLNSLEKMVLNVFIRKSLLYGDTDSDKLNCSLIAINCISAELLCTSTVQHLYSHSFACTTCHRLMVNECTNYLTNWFPLLSIRSEICYRK